MLITLSLSETELIYVRQQIAEKGLPAIEDYLHGLLKEQIQKNTESAQDVPPALRPGSREKVEAMVLEAMSGGGQVMTREDFAQMRRDLVNRFGPSQGK